MLAALSVNSPGIRRYRGRVWRRGRSYSPGESHEAWQRLVQRWRDTLCDCQRKPEVWHQSVFHLSSFLPFHSFLLLSLVFLTLYDSLSLSHSLLSSVPPWLPRLSFRSLYAQVDDNHMKSVPVSSFGFHRSSLDLFFIGGLPSGMESQLPIRLQEFSKSFRGCIQHLVIDGA